MYKKLITACMALAAFIAFAVMPATASATNDPQLTDGAGNLVAAGTLIKGTQIGLTTRLKNTNNEILLTCTTSEMTGKVVKNEASTVEGEITTAHFGGTGGTINGDVEPECTGIVDAGVTPLNTPWCLRSTAAMVTDEFQVSSGACPGGGKIKFNLTTTSIGVCEYEATSVIKGHFKTSAEDALLTVTPKSTESGFKKTGGSFFCPGSGTLEMTFTLEQDTTPTSDPLYIS